MWMKWTEGVGGTEIPWKILRGDMISIFHHKIRIFFNNWDV